jgi:hypothetical protein
MHTVVTKLKRLPQNLNNEAVDWIDLLLETRAKMSAKKPALNWNGRLKKFKGQYTALGL